MAKRSLEESFRKIKPKWPIAPTPTIAVSASSDSGDLAGSLSQAGQQIAQLEQAYQQQLATITANTQALEKNTSTQGGNSAGSTVGSVASSLFGGLFGFVSPLISGIASLFGGSSTPAALPVYTPPPPISISANLSSAAPVAVNSATPVASSNAGSTAVAGGVNPALTAPFNAPLSPAELTPYSLDLGPLAPSPFTATNIPAAGNSVQPPPAPSPVQTAQTAPQITVNVSAMDSQSFLDHSTDIANAVREAMLNMHPINDVVASL